MFKNRLIYRIFVILLFFALASMLPIIVFIGKEIREITEGMDVARVREHITSYLMTVSFAVFFLAFLLSLFFSRSLLLPVRELHRGAKSIRDGNLDTVLSAPSKDELGEVIDVFNEMVRSLKEISLENVRLYEEMSSLYEYQHRKRKEERETLLALSSRLACAIDIKEAIDTTLKLIMSSFKADLALLLMPDRSGELVLKSTAGDFNNMLPFGEHSFLDSVETKAWREQRPVFALLSPGRLGPENLLAVYESAVSVPIAVGEKGLGIFSLYFQMSQELTEEDIHFLMMVSGIVAVSMERSGYYEKMLNEKGMAEVVFNSMSDGLFTVDTGLVITSVNRAAERLLGLSSADMLGRKCSEVIMHTCPENDKLLCGDECPLSFAAEGVPMSREMDFPDRSGKKVSLSVSNAPLIDAGGALIGAVQVFRDITREKEIARMKTEFVRTVSHEFRTPLSAIIGMTEMLIEKEVEGERVEDYLHTIQDEGRRLSGMVTDLLDISRIESGEGIFNESGVDFEIIFNDIRKTFSDIIKSKGMGLEIQAHAGTRGFVGDGDKLKQLLMNLVGNSMMYSDKGCPVTVRVTKAGERLRLEVADRGWGIPEQELSFLTRKFFRGSNGLKTKGTGLGLSLCKEIVHLHGGAMRIASRHGEGTTVRVELPWKNNPGGILRSL